VLGDVEETIYAVDDEDEDEETKVSKRLAYQRKLTSDDFPKDDKQEIRDAVCAR
jgi:hypothetical protein